MLNTWNFDIIDKIYPVERAPSTKQHTVRADLHRHVRLLDLEMFESKNRHTRPRSHYCFKNPSMPAPKSEKS